MSMSEQQLRTLGLSHVRRRIAAGDYTDDDVERWVDELGEGVRDLVPKKPKKSTKKSDTSTTSTDKE